VCVYVDICFTNLLTLLSALPEAQLHEEAQAVVAVATTGDGVPSDPNPEVLDAEVLAHLPFDRKTRDRSEIQTCI
jgi:hypothetical protein